VTSILVDATSNFDSSACGTPAGYSRHRKADQKPCDLCRLAQNAHYLQYRKKREVEDLSYRTSRIKWAREAYDRKLEREGRVRKTNPPIRRADFSSDKEYNRARHDRYIRPNLGDSRTIEYRANNHMWWKFKRTLVDYDRVLAEQGGGCASCGNPPLEDNKRLGWDHDHLCCPQYPTCGACVRGLLCQPCNTLVGFVESGRLGLTVAYLERVTLW
jgi:hypothetical protein